MILIRHVDSLLRVLEGVGLPSEIARSTADIVFTRVGRETAARPRDLGHPQKARRNDQRRGELLLQFEG